jgi:hypothetical protein
MTRDALRGEASRRAAAADDNGDDDAAAVSEDASFGTRFALDFSRWAAAAAAGVAGYGWGSSSAGEFVKEF